MMHTKTVTAAGQRLGFQIHAAAYIVGIVVMTALNLYFGEPYWFVWPLLGWTIGVIAHWWFVLGPGATRA